MTQLEKIVAVLTKASATGIQVGGDWARNEDYIERCTRDAQLQLDRRVRIIYTRDLDPESLHSLHLSLSFVHWPSITPLPFDHAFGRQAANAFFRPYVENLIVQPPETKQGITLDVWHYRVFTTPWWDPTSPPGVPRGAMRWSQYLQ